MFVNICKKSAFVKMNQEQGFLDPGVYALSH